jgi:hypothetical protein
LISTIIKVYLSGADMSTQRRINTQEFFIRGVTGRRVKGWFETRPVYVSPPGGAPKA